MQSEILRAKSLVVCPYFNHTLAENYAAPDWNDMLVVISLACISS